MEFRTEKELVDDYILSKQLPYITDVLNPQIEIFREFEIGWKEGICRYDLMYVNHTEKRYDIMEFKNRPLQLKDAYQVYKYIKSFLYNLYKGNVFNQNYKYCFHLIGQDTKDERVDNLILIQSNIFKVHTFYKTDRPVEVYENCLANIDCIWT